MFAEDVVVLVNVKDEGGSLDHTFLKRTMFSVSCVDPYQGA